MLLKATQVTVLLRCIDEKGIIRIPVDDPTKGYFGLTKTLDASQAVSRQLVTYVAGKIGRPDLIPHIEVLSMVEPILEAEGSSPSMLYLMRIDPAFFKADSSWPTLISGLKSMPSGKTRLAYNKALQYFAGAADAPVDILEMDREVMARLSELIAQKPPTLLE